MSRLATLAVLLLSLLAVASCRVLEAISDDQGPPNPADLTQDQADAAAEVILPRLPTPTVAAGEGVLRLPSHRRPCHLHRHLWWARHHGLSHRHGAFSGPGEARVHLAVDVVPTELARGEEKEPTEAELEAVAEPDPDSRPDTDGEQKPFHGEEEEAAKAWKGEMLRRFRHGIRFHHRHHLRHDHEQEEHDEHEQDKDEGMHMKLFRRFHHHHAHDSDGEVDEVEELARRLSEAIMRRSFNHGGHHHHGADGGVKKWFKGLMNLF